jgi:hypothetical protein
MYSFDAKISKTEKQTSYFHRGHLYKEEICFSKITFLSEFETEANLYFLNLR